MTGPKIITSLTNDRVKAIRALGMRKTRKETALFIAEGVSLLISARDRGVVPQTLVYRSGEAESGFVRGLITFALKEGAEVLEVSQTVLAKLASKDNPQTVLGVYRQRFAAPPEPQAIASSSTWIALEEVRDPGNLGTIVRTADAAGCAGIILVGACCDAYQSEAVRATMGSIFAVPIVKMEPEPFLALAAAWPGDVVAATLDARDDFRTTYRGPELVVMGGEGPGLSDAAVAAATRRVKIPMAGDLDSLNLAIATALILYQVRGARLKL
ncbi:MAG: TrmH family RNA methyltransferase [Hyphomicrobium sp.]